MKQEKDGAISYEGFCIDLLKQLTKMLNFTYEIYLSPDGQYGEITQKGTWNGIIGELVDKVSTLCDISLRTAGQSDILDHACSIKSCCHHHHHHHIHEKTSAVARRRGSEKLRFVTKILLLTRVKLPGRKKITRRTFGALSLRQSEWRIINPSYTKLLSSQPMALRKKSFLFFEMSRSTSYYSSLMYPGYDRADFKLLSKTLALRLLPFVIG